MNLPFFVGLWPFVAHFGIGAIVIAASIAVALFSVEIGSIPFLGRFASHIRTVALCVAAAAAAAMFFYAVGVRDRDTQCRLQFQAAKVLSIKQGTAARAGAARDDDRGVRDPRDTDQH